MTIYTAHLHFSVPFYIRLDTTLQSTLPFLASHSAFIFREGKDCLYRHGDWFLVVTELHETSRRQISLQCERRQTS